MRDLPIDPLLPEIVSRLRESRVLVLEAEPGAGKTTRVPRALLEAGLAGSGRLVVTEPRRLAARLAATFVARELGEPVGRTVGYSVRFEHVAGRDTRLFYVTEGVLSRRLLADPLLSDVGLIVLDEFHERHLSTDVLLALVDRLMKESRPDLRLVVMSATLEAEALATHLDAPRVHARGRAFPLRIEHAERADDRPLERQVASAVKRALAEEETGDVLVFLPGARDIRRSGEALAAESASGNVLVLPLHGDLSVAEQARAVEPSNRRKVILATNVAESSVTIDGVTVVVDSGLSRVAGHSPWSGVATLTTGKISRASATQRAGRAGRTREGRVLRLYTSGDLATRPEHDRPEIVREDLAEAFLELHGAGVDDPSSLRWLEPPPEASARAAEKALTAIGALDGAGKLTQVGRRMLDFPLSPRLARVVVEGERRGVARDACLAAALLSERDLRDAARATFGARGPGRSGVIDASGPSDVLELMERFHEAEDADFDARRLGYMGIDSRTAKAVARTRDKLASEAEDGAERPSGIDAVDDAVCISLLTGFSDQLARRRGKASRDLVLRSGKTARLADTSVVHDAQLLVAVDAEEVPGRGITVRLASGIRPEWLFELYPDRMEMSDDLAWNAESRSVERVSRISWGSVVIEEDREHAPPSDAASALLYENVRGRTSGAVADERTSALLVRLELLRKHVPEAGLPEVATNVVDEALQRACQGSTRASQLAELDLPGEILDGLPREARGLLDKETPERLSLPGGQTVQVHYESGKPPWVESRLQDFFGMVRSPTLCRGRLPLTVHLLAPNRRAVQVTTDLAGFWERHYPGIRRELCRKYPRHPWPEDGEHAAPPAPRPPRR